MLWRKCLKKICWPAEIKPVSYLWYVYFAFSVLAKSNTGIPVIIILKYNNMFYIYYYNILLYILIYYWYTCNNLGIARSIIVVAWSAAYHDIVLWTIGEDVLCYESRFLQHPSKHPWITQQPQAPAQHWGLFVL